MLQMIFISFTTILTLLFFFFFRKISISFTSILALFDFFLQKDFDTFHKPYLKAFHFFDNILSSMEYGGISTFYLRGYFYDISTLQHIQHKNQTRKIVKIYKHFGLYQVFMYNSLCQNVLKFPIHSRKKLKHFFDTQVRYFSLFS